MRWVVAMLGVLLAGSSVTAQAKKDKDKPKAAAGIPGYKKQTIQGFTLLIHDEVYKQNDDAKWKRKPLDVLDLELGTVVRRLPEKGVKVLQRLTIWIEWHDDADPDLEKGVVAKYYGVSGNLGLWSLGKNKHPLKANNVEVINMESLTREHQPGVSSERCVLLHEMAHAVHHQLLGFNHDGVKAAYKQAMARKLYEEATDVNGRTLKPPYAAKNENEYFAELTCAYIDKLHYFPFTPEDLQKHDPAGYKLMEKVWGTRKQIETALTAKTEKEAARLVEQARGYYTVDKIDAGVAILERVIHDFPDTKAAATAKGWVEKWKARKPS